MAILTKNVLGKPIGKVGDIVFKNVNGKIILATHIGSNKISDSPACVNNRSNFSSVVKFALAVNKIPELNQVWRSSDIKGHRTHNKIISANSKYTVNRFVSEKNIITPLGLLLKISSWAFDKKSLTVTFTLPGNSNNYRGRKFTACFVLALSNPVSKTSKPVEFFGTTEENIALPVNEPAVITKSFSKQQTDAIKLYKIVRIYFAIADVSGKKPLFSSSYSHEFSISK